ncbi:MAG: hypothetical protein WCI46_00965 [Verrucomicrobiota bacterium]
MLKNCVTSPRLLALLLLAFSSISCRQKATDKDAVFGVIHENVHALEKKDINTLMSTIHPDCATYAETRATVEQMFKSFDLKYEVSDLKIVNSNGSEVKVSFKQKTTQVGTQADFNDNIVEGIHTLKLDRGNWKIIKTLQQKITDLNGAPLFASAAKSSISPIEPAGKLLPQSPLPPSEKIAPETPTPPTPPQSPDAIQLAKNATLQAAVFAVINDNARALEKKNLEAVVETIDPSNPDFATTKASIATMFKVLDLSFVVSDLQITNATPTEVVVSFKQQTKKVGGSAPYVDNLINGLHTLRLDHGTWKIFKTTNLSATELKPNQSTQPPKPAVPPSIVSPPVVLPPSPARKP